MSKNKFWSNVFVFGTTLIIFSIYITAVFFTVEGNWAFLGTLDYWSEILSGSVFAFLLRYLWSLTGVDVALVDNEKITKKEEEKSKLISKVDTSSLIGDLESVVDDTNLLNKKTAYKNKCDRKIKFWRNFKVFPKHNKIANKWVKEKDETQDDEFNWDNVKVKYYKYKKDNLLSSYFKGDDDTDGDTSNTTLLGMTLTSMRTNLLTIIAMIFFTALNVLSKDFYWNEVYILLGKLVIFMMNMNNGFRMGKKYINVLYNRQLTKDYIFLKKFLDSKGI